MSDEQQDDALRDAYRRASARDADRPSAATRAAILAAGAAAARRNAPAANQSRYWLRAVAGVAVLGIGVVLWRETDDSMQGDAPMVASAPAPREQESEAKAARTAESARADTVAANEIPAPQPFPASPAVAPAAVAPPAAASPPSPPPVAELSPPQLARNTADEDLSEVAITGARIQAPEGPALLRQHFPAQYQSDAPHSVWLVMNAAGEVVQSGELMPGERLADLASQRARASGGRAPGPWQLQTLRNARGQPITLAIARLP